ncbi:hypothetical protein [Croceivirga thetidis]|nr:hypothetical protein [Croceivirga thetidis]
MAFILNACTEDVNFSQADDLEVEPTLASSIFYFESTEEVINLAGSGAFYTEDFTFEAFSEAFVADRILDGVITYQLENSTSKQIDLEIEFLDANGNTIDSEFFSIQPEPAPITEIQVAYGDGGKSLDILRNTRTIRVNGSNLGDDTSISSQPEPKIILRSSAAFTVKLQ